MDFELQIDHVEILLCLGQLHSYHKHLFGTKWLFGKSSTESNLYYSAFIILLFINRLKVCQVIKNRHAVLQKSPEIRK